MIKVLLAGQPNCGKSTIFNLLSGLNQRIANYPGVTVDKKSAHFSYMGEDIELIDLPGTYSLSSFSLEEKIAKKAIIEENPDLIVNILDASNLKRNLYLSFQLLEIGKPLIMVLNMTDVAKQRGLSIDIKQMEQELGFSIIQTSGIKGEGKEELLKAIVDVKNQEYEEFKINYEELEPYIEKLQSKIQDANLPKRWLSIKALEEDEVALELLEKEPLDARELSKSIKDEFSEKTKLKLENFLASTRYGLGELVCSKALKEEKRSAKTLSDRVDELVLNRWLAFPILFLVIFLVYELSIVFGYKLTDYTWVILAHFKQLVVSFLPEANFTQVPIFRDFGIWMVNSANALLNYIPIFFILFALIAVLEDVGYMPRIAFILDRIFRKFGLHGQSTLPLVLGGAFVGGCAVPGVMSTKGIADERARMATILSVPLMNCLAKVPFYTLLLGAFFPNHLGLMMFYISTITMFLALLIAKFTTSTFLKTRQTAPFVMELPPYHLPTFKGVFIRASQRVWQYIKKVVSIVLAVAVILFMMLQFPMLSNKSKAHYEQKAKMALASFDKKAKKTKYYKLVNKKDKTIELLNYYDNFRTSLMLTSSKEAKSAVKDEYRKQNAQFFELVRPKNKDARVINKALRKLSKSRNKILRNIKSEKIENSMLGMIGKSIEPVSKYAGFDWKINIAFLSSFVARESAVATLGSLYENNKSKKQRSEEAMAQNSGYTPLHATAIIIFMLLTPPCIATMIVVKMQTNSYMWMSFSIFFPMLLGLLLASLVFSLGLKYTWSGVEAMSYYYVVTVALTFFVGLFPQKNINFSGRMIKNKKTILKEKT